MTRIFIPLALISVLLLSIAFFLGLGIDDPRVRDAAVQHSVSVHMMTGMAGLVGSALVHAIVFTYFMGTGRWIEETTRAYRLTSEFHVTNQTLKYRLLPGILLVIMLLALTGGLGGAADPASPVQFQGVWGLSAAKVHLVVAALMLLVNLAVHLQEFRSIEHNGQTIELVMNEVRRIRTERGLPT